MFVGFGLERKQGAGWITWGSTAPTTDAATFPTCSGRRVWFLESRTTVYFKAECLLCVSCCASGNLGNKGRTCMSWKKVHLQALLSLRWKPIPSWEIWWMLAHKYVKLIVSQRYEATLSWFQINIDQALLPDRYKHCQLPELWWKERGS